MCESAADEPVALAFRLEHAATLPADDAADVCEVVRQRAMAAELMVLAAAAALLRSLRWLGFEVARRRGHLPMHEDFMTARDL